MSRCPFRATDWRKVSLASKAKTALSTMIGLVLVAVVATVWTTTKEPACSRSNNLVLSVKWNPEVLSIQLPVRITVTVDGTPMVRRTKHISPWGETMTACHDAVVILRATTGHPSVFWLDCIILRDGRTIDGRGYDSLKGPGRIECRS